MKKKIKYQTKEGLVISESNYYDYKFMIRAIWKAIRAGAETLVRVDTERGETMDLTDILQSRKLTL